MTVIRTIRDGGLDRSVLPGDAVWSQAIAVARLVDAGSGLPVADVRVRSLDDRVVARVATGGWLVLVGATVVTDAIAAGAQTFDVEIVTARARRTATLNVPAATSLPFTAPDISIGSALTTVTGVVTQAAFPNPPISGAAVGLRGTVPGGAAVGLRVGVSAGHAAGTTVQVRPTPTAPLTTLDGAVAAGDRFVRLTSVATVAAGTWLVFAGELHEVVGVESATRLVELRLPLLRSRPDLAAVDEATPGAIGASTALLAAVERGDSVLVTAGAVVGDNVEIVDGTSTELCLVGIETDGSGRYRFGTVRGLAAVEVTAAATGFTTESVTRPLDPARSNHVIDLRLT